MFQMLFQCIEWRCLIWPSFHMVCIFFISLNTHWVKDIFHTWTTITWKICSFLKVPVQKVNSQVTLSLIKCLRSTQIQSWSSVDKEDKAIRSARWRHGEKGYFKILWITGREAFVRKGAKLHFLFYYLHICVSYTS